MYAVSALNRCRFRSVERAGGVLDSPLCRLYLTCELDPSANLVAREFLLIQGGRPMADSSWSEWFRLKHLGVCA